MAAFRRWLLLARIPLVLLVVVLSLSLYNRFLVNSNLQNLKRSLSILDAATGVGQAEAALLLVDQTLVASMAQEELDLKAVATLQYAQGNLSSDQRGRSVVDTQVLVGSLAEEQKAARSGALGVLDTIASGIQQAVTRTALLPRQVGRRVVSQEMDEPRLAQAARWEQMGLLLEAAQAYGQIIRSYPNYAGRTGLKLRLGYLYQRSQSFDQAQQLYREALRESRDPKETGVAQELLGHLGQVRKQYADAKRLEQKMISLGAGAERQRAQFELGSIWLQLYAMEKAAQAFHAAALADPEGELVLPSLFKEAWCLRRSGRMEESLRSFQEVIQRNPQTLWAAAARQQIAEAYRATGDYASAMQNYEELIKETKDTALTALALAQAGSTALYDLKNPDKARDYFEKLASQFPASSLSSIEKEIFRLETARSALSVSAAQAATPGSPLFGWAARTLPIFVQTFADRLARYMDAVKEPRITRRYTEEEFRQNVLRRVQERFPGQIEVFEVKIRPTGYTASGAIKLGPLTFPVEGRVGIELAEGRPHVAVHEARLWKIPVPAGLLQQLSKEVNSSVDRLKLPLEVTQYDLKEGYAVITVERRE